MFLQEGARKKQRLGYCQGYGRGCRAGNLRERETSRQEALARQEEMAEQFRVVRVLMVSEK